MKIEDAVAALEQEFGAQTELPKPDLTLHLSSGDRIGSPIDAAPALCLNRELAAKLWYETARDALRKAGVGAWKLHEKPIMDLWRITIADARQTHRIAAARFSVVGTIDVKVAPKEAEPVSLPAAADEKSQGDTDGLSGQRASYAATADDDAAGTGGSGGADAAGAWSTDAGADADRRSTAADAAAGPAEPAPDQP